MPMPAAMAAYRFSGDLGQRGLGPGDAARVAGSAGESAQRQRGQYLAERQDILANLALRA